MKPPFSFPSPLLTVAFLFLLLLVPGTEVRGADQNDLQRGVDLNESAKAKMHAGNLDGAEMDLLQALVYSKQNPQVRKNLGVVYYEKGVRAYKVAKNYQDARRYLKQALEIDSQNDLYRRAYANALLVEAEVRGKQGQMRRALELYKEAADLDAGNLAAWVRASNYAWETHQMDLARRYLAKAKAIDPSDRNVQVLEQKMARSGPAEDTGTETSEHFVLSADPKYIKYLGSHRILYDLEDAFNKVSFKLSYYPKNKIAVVFYPLKDFHSHWRVPRKVEAVYDGKLRIPYARRETSVEVMRPIIMHELTHAFLDLMTPRDLPAWLNEGLAQWVEGKSLEGNTRKALLSHEARGVAPKIPQLDQALAGQDTVAYVKSFSIVEFLIQRHGIWQLKKLVEHFDPGVPLDVPFKKYFHAGVSEVESSWLKWLSSST